MTGRGLIGRTLAHYRIVARLGGGGMGEVYRAEDTRLHRQVALKVLPPGMAADAERLERFAREAKAVGGLNHPNIVTIYSVEEIEGLHVLAMELVEGGTLGEAIPAGGLSEERFFELAIALADALSAAHERGVTHRDLKPSNVMLTGEGRVKVVDFGLAKLRQEVQAREQTVVLDQDLTEEGRVLGTYPYMAPEQVKGRPADDRSDVFSLGVVLYEMATGERPFAGETSADLISSILRDTPPPAHEINRQLPRHLDRILAHCLEKDPDRRFQTAKDLRNELQSLERERHSERVLRTSSLAGRLAHGLGGRKRLWLGAAVAVALAAAVAVAALLLPGTAGGPEAAASARTAAAEEEARRPSVAVLFFQNLTGEPELEWLRAGFAEMLVTDLSQSPGLRVVSTDRLYEILKELGRLDEPILSADLVRDVAARADVRTVVLGSFARAGEALLVNVTLQRADEGEILDAQRVQGVGEASVFSIVDRLSEGVRGSFQDAARAPDARPDLERGIESVTTSSVEAYRFYVEGMRLGNDLKIEEAIALFQRAVELDPGFAMAHARLARIYETLGREKELRQSLERAVSHADRLPPRERFFVEASSHSRIRATYGQAIETLEEAVELYPDHHSARYQLALLYTYVELYEQAAGHLEELLRRGFEQDGIYNALAHAREAAGRSEEARALLEGWDREGAGRWVVPLVRAWHAVNRADSRAAFAEVARAEELRPGSSFNDHVRWRAAMVAGRWDEAAAAAGELSGADDSYWRWRGLVQEALLLVYRGLPAEALARLEDASGAYGGAEPLAGTSRDLAADLLLDLGRPREALREAEAARRAARGDWPASEALFWAALAHQELGDPAAADRLAAELERHAERVPGRVEERFHRRLLGLLALARGDGAAAVAELERAEALLPPRGLPWHRHRLPDHVDVWYDLAEAYRALGRSAAAVERYRRIVESGTEHVYHPVEYVRSHYLLGRLLEERRDEEGARSAYRAFVSFWGDGELDRERVADARARLRRLGG